MADFPASYVSLLESKSNLIIRKQALKQKKADSDSSAASDTSDEETSYPPWSEHIPHVTVLVATRVGPVTSYKCYKWS